MSRLIDADALIADLDKGLWGKDWDKALAEAIINDAPTIDAVSVVRCKECRYKDMELCAMYKLVVAGVRKYDDFCSYGEREGE